MRIEDQDLGASLHTAVTGEQDFGSQAKGLQTRGPSALAFGVPGKGVEGTCLSLLAEHPRTWSLTNQFAVRSANPDDNPPKEESRR